MFQTIPMAMRCALHQHHCMDTMQAMPDMGHASQGRDATPDYPTHARHTPPGAWHELTHAAVGMAWTRDPEVMNDLVGTLLDFHLHHRPGAPEAPLDELHLMIALELQQLSGEPD